MKNSLIIMMFISWTRIKLDPQGTTIYRKSAHTGQYRHFSSFTPWSRKVAWIRALVQRAIKICSTQQLLRLEIQDIKQFASWNGFPRWLSDKLIHSFTSQTPKPTRDNNDPVHTIWIKLLLIRKKGNFLIRNCTRKISRLLKRPVKFVNHWDVVESNTFTSQKDPTPKPYKTLLLFKEAYHIRRCDPLLNHGARASKELTIFR